jgi:hypothetical protein
MSTTPGQPHDPLREKLKAAAETLTRRRQGAFEASVRGVEERNAFFDKLAVLNAGALTFSVTLLGHSVQKSLSTLFILYAAWLFLLVALGACLVRNFSNSAYRFSDAASKRAESEISYIDADNEIVSSRSIIYQDSTEPFDRDREIKVNKENREVWQTELARHQQAVNRKSRLFEVAEWVASICMFAGFLLLIVFAIFSSLSPAASKPS